MFSFLVSDLHFEPFGSLCLCMKSSLVFCSLSIKKKSAYSFIFRHWILLCYLITSCIANQFMCRHTDIAVDTNTLNQKNPLSITDLPLQLIS